MSKIKTIGAVIVTYNRKELLTECLDCLLKQDYKNIEVLVIDNASTDGTEDHIKKYIKKENIHYINTGANLGGAGGFNFGMREAFKRNYDYIWLMDDDSMINDPKTASSFIEKAALLKDDFSFMSCPVKWTDGSLCIMNRQTFSDEWANHAEFLDKGLIPIKTATFVSFFINTKVAKKVGLPIKEFFIYSDDIEYSYRLGKVKPAYLNTSCSVLHKMASNSGGSIVNAPYDRIDRTFYNHRNLEYIVRHHYNKREKRYGYRHKYLQNVYYILRLAPDHKLKRLAVLTKGKLAGLFFNPKVEKE